MNPYHHFFEEAQIVTDRQTDKFFNTIYEGMWIFISGKFATAVLASLAGGLNEEYMLLFWPSSTALLATFPTNKNFREYLICQRCPKNFFQPILFCLS